MKAGSYGAWLFIPDHLVLKAGDVTFVAVNEMNESHDLVISPIGDVSAFIETRLAEGQADYKRINGLELMSDLSPRRTASTTVALAPGIYVAACYMVSKATDGTALRPLRSRSALHVPRRRVGVTGRGLTSGRVPERVTSR